MAEIDVSEVINDPEFQDTFIVTRSTEVLDEHGRASFMPKPIPATGVVQPASGRTMELTPEATRTSEMIEIWTQFGLQEATDASAADEITWKGKTYIVSHTDPWDNWGSGFVHVVCTRKQLFPESTPL